MINIPQKSSKSEDQGKSSGIHGKKLFNLNATKLSIKSTITDDSGKYLYKETTSKFYYWLENDDTTSSVHSNEDDSWFIRKRNGSAYDEVSVDKKHIYVVKRT